MKSTTLKLLFIFISAILLSNPISNLFAGGNMSNITKKSLYNQLIELEKQKGWKMLTERSERVEPSYKKIFELCSLHSKKNKTIDIGLFSPADWPSINLGNYALSPDGNEIAFVIDSRDAAFNSVHALYLLNIKSGVIKTVLSPQRFPEISCICYLPDGKNILFVGKLNDIEETTNIPQFNSLYKLNLDTKDISELVKHGVYTINTQSCSPDGSKIVYETGSFNEIYLYDSITGSSHKLADGKYPTWQPDGGKISYCGKDGNYYLISPNGLDNKIFIPNKAKDELKIMGEKVGIISGEILWSPDGQFVYYQRVASQLLADVEHYVPYIRNIDTQEEVKLPSNLGAIKSWVGNK